MTTSAELRFDDDSDGSPVASNWCAVPVMLCVMLGALLVGWAYASEHPDVLNGAPPFMQALVPPPEPIPAAAGAAPRKPPPAASASVAAAGSASAAPAPAPSAAAAAPPPVQTGFVSMTGPKGARVFDGDTLLGKAPLLQAVNAGAHVFRVQTAGSSKSEAFNIEVRPAETSPIIVPSKRRSRR